MAHENPVLQAWGFWQCRSESGSEISVEPLWQCGIKDASEVQLLVVHQVAIHLMRVRSSSQVFVVSVV